MTRHAVLRWALPARARVPAFDLSGLTGLTVRGSRSRSRSATYVDTEDLRLTRWGCALARYEREGWILTVGTGDTAGPQLVEHEMRFAASPQRDVPDDAADLLVALTRGAPLRPVLRARVEEVTYAATQRGTRDTLEVVDRRVVAYAGRRIAGRFHEVVLTPNDDGADSPLLQRVSEALLAAGGEESAATPLLRRTLSDAGADQPDVVIPDAARGGPARDAIQRAIASSVLRLITHDAAVRIGSDPEGVHQARVATRRLRSDLRTFKPLLDAEWTQRLRDDLHRLADLLGAVRDADVLLARLSDAAAHLPEDDQPAAQAALSSLNAERVAARTTLLAEMRSPGYVALLDELVDAAAQPRTLPDAGGHAGELLPPLARKPWRRVQARVELLGGDPADAELHEVRILAKRARYAAEAVAPVSRRGVAAFAKAVAAVQDALGEHHDAIVAEAWLRTVPSPGADQLVLGQLIGLERAEAARARAAWPALWKDAVQAQPKTWA